MEDPIPKKSKTRAQTQDLSFQDSRPKKLSKSQDLKDKSSHFGESSTHIKKVDKNFDKKTQKERKEQHF